MGKSPAKADPVVDAVLYAIADTVEKYGYQWGGGIKPEPGGFKIQGFITKVKK